MKKTCFFMSILAMLAVCVISLVSCNNETSMEDQIRNTTEEINDAEEAFAASVTEIVSCQELLGSVTRTDTEDYMGGLLLPTTFTFNIEHQGNKYRFKLAWSNWGHGSDCRGWGLCDFSFVFEYSQNGFGAAPMVGDNMGSLNTYLTLDTENNCFYVPVLCKFSMGPAYPFVVSEDIVRYYRLDDRSVACVTIVQGQYTFNSSLGQHGGYLLNAEFSIIPSPEVNE